MSEVVENLSDSRRDRMSSLFEVMDNSIPQMSKEIDQIAGALSSAQSELEVVNKGEKGFGYNYASLASTIATANEVLKKNGLAVSQLVGTEENGHPSITTVLMHKSGQFIKSVANMPLIEMKGVNEAQRAGAVYSYLRRYALQAILNMASEDNDASSNGFSKKASLQKDEKSETEPKRTRFRREKKDEDDI